MATVDEPPILGQLLVSNFAGVSAGPWHQFLRGSAAEWLGPYTPESVELWILKRMREDPQIKLGRNAIRSPFFGITYRIDQRSGTPETRAFVRKTVLEAPIFHQILASILRSFEFGFQSSELLWTLRDVEIDQDGPGGLPPQLIQAAASLTGLVEIDPEQVEPVVNERNELVSIRVGQITIPAAKVLHAVHEGEWGNLLGNPMLRAAYNPWYWCNFLNLYMMRYGETRITPPLLAYAPFDLRYDEDTARSGASPKNALDVIAEQAVSLRNGSVAALPDERDDKGNRRFSIEAMRDEGRVEQFILAINHMQALKLRALCIPERAFTQDTETGSFAMVKEHVDAFLMNLEVFKLGTVIPALNWIAERVTRANFRSAPAPLFVASELARAKQEAMFDLVSKALDVPLTLEDGRSYQPKQLIDFVRCFESMNIPHFLPRDVASEEGVNPDRATYPALAALDRGIPLKADEFYAKAGFTPPSQNDNVIRVVPREGEPSAAPG